MVAARYGGEAAERGPVNRYAWRRAARIALIVWAALVTAYFLWEFAHYRGIFALASDAQDRAFGRSFPVVTLFLLIMLFAAPTLLLLRSKPVGLDAVLPRQARYNSARRFERTLRRAAIGFGAAAAIAALFAGIITPALYPDTANGRIVSAASETTDNGPGEVRGDLRFSIAASHTLDAVVFRKDVRLVPITAPGDPAKRLRYFAEYDPGEVPDAARDRPNGTRAGNILAGRVPPAILSLYKDAGYEIAQPAYLVGRSRGIVTTPYWSLAVVLLVAALVALALTAVQRRHVRQLAAEEGEGEAAPAPLN